MEKPFSLAKATLFLLIFPFNLPAHVWAVTPVAREIWALFDIILTIGIITGVIVIGALVYVVFRFRETGTAAK
jgi:heme/copper-type cytochrome/quinol oxidase subunit 2